MKFEIKQRWSGAILFALETDSLKLCVEAAVKADANLEGAYLAGADLAGAYLARAYLVGANLAGAYLAGADLARANLVGAYLAGADLAGADLAGADGNKLTLVGLRPLLTLGPLGSRSAFLSAFLTDDGVYVRTGCFWGSLESFRAAVIETHGGNNHATEYAAAIALIEVHARLWTQA